MSDDQKLVTIIDYIILYCYNTGTLEGLLSEFLGILILLNYTLNCFTSDLWCI